MTTTRMFVMRTALLITGRVLPEKRPGELRPHRRDLGHRSADVRGAAGHDLVLEIGHVRAVGGEADRDRQLALLVQEIQVTLDVGCGEGRSTHGAHPLRWGFPYNRPSTRGIRDIYVLGRPPPGKVSARCVIQRTRCAWL